MNVGGHVPICLKPDTTTKSAPIGLITKDPVKALDVNILDVGGIGWWGGVAGKGLWGCGGRRKGGQVRFSAAQTGALERRFATAKYLSPDERRALATSLRLSDRQVKTWYQNRRAKWRRSTTDGDDGSAADSSPASDQDEPGPPDARSLQHVIAVTSH